ncbi:effector-associated domain 2-containing protein [Streptomyces gobiensis]|uniref:VMAP-C domain-containing protein n=1 Tax=Streptomyces gobiensis TaxID=2875706 RepID=UPI001E3B7F37|nr:hypothetical protein [Streptomyces gobiensis]UGY94484.1 hypothetical protein test1122_23965 [Streptomyces gobiensis]
MVEVLGGSAALADPRGRHQWRRELTDALEGLALEPYPTPRQEFIDAIRACGARPGGLELLLEITHFVVPALSHRLRPLLDEWNAADLYGTRDWTALHSALDIGLPELNTMVTEVCGDRIRLPSHCATAWHAFVHLACRNTPPGGLPPSMVLLEHLALHADLASSVGELHAWNDHFAQTWKLTHGHGGLLALRAALATDRALGGSVGAERRAEDNAAPERPVIRLFIKVEPDLTPVEAKGRRRGREETRYRLSSRVRYAESPGLHQEDADEPQGPVPRSRISVAVAELLTRMAELWQSRSEDVVLEFFLPTELLNEPVEWWDRDPRLDYANPLLSKYPEIFTHSLERVQRRELHHAWRLRWARWQSQPDKGDVYWCDPDGRRADEHLALLDARIGKRDEVVAMVLSGPPQPGSGLGLRELRLGLDLGVPVFIHHREDSASQAFRSLVSEGLNEDGLVKLPTRARHWKGDSAAGGLDSDEDPARHLSLVWDDPELLLDGGPCAPATFVGGID